MIPKYKAWDTRQKRMYFPKELTDDGMTLSVDGRGFVNVSGSDVRFDEYYPHLIPLQATGLTDKNRTPIYAGDIALLTSMEGQTVKVEVKYDPTMCAFGFLGIRGRGLGWISIDSFFNKNSIDQIEIIGDVHQHPELLEGKT